MMDLEFKFAGGILGLVGLMSLISGVGGVCQSREVNFIKVPKCSSKLCVPYAPSLLFIPLLFTRSYWAFKLGPDKLTKLNRLFGSFLGCEAGMMTYCFCREPNPLACAWK